MRERVTVKSPVLENGTPGSVRGALGNWRPYRDVSMKRGFAPIDENVVHLA